MADSSAVRAAMKANLIGRRIISHQVRAHNVDRNQQTGELSLSQLDRKKTPAASSGGSIHPVSVSSASERSAVFPLPT